VFEYVTGIELGGATRRSQSAGRAIYSQRKPVRRESEVHRLRCRTGAELPRRRFVVLELVDTKRIDQSIELEIDESKKNHLHPIAGSETAKVGARRFLKPSA
jgi:hypothetical protein